MVLVYIFRRSQEQKQKEVAMLLWLSSWRGGDLVDWSDDHRVGEKPMELGYVCG